MLLLPFVLYGWKTIRFVVNEKKLFDYFDKLFRCLFSKRKATELMKFSQNKSILAIDNHKQSVHFFSQEMTIFFSLRQYSSCNEWMSNTIIYNWQWHWGFFFSVQFELQNTNNNKNNRNLYGNNKFHWCNERDWTNFRWFSQIAKCQIVLVSDWHNYY